MCYCGNKGVERTLNKSQYTKLTLEKKILPLLLYMAQCTLELQVQVQQDNHLCNLRQANSTGYLCG